MDPYPPTPNTQAQLLLSSFASLPLPHILEDLSARFIVNLPNEELESMDRVCFQIEQAHWYYEDFIRPQAANPSLLPSYGLKAFSLLMFKSCALLHDLVPSHPQIWTSFMAYKERVPVCGAIMISEYWDKVLLVKGWNKGASWSFPRGKINKEEPEAMCAVREVLEETGFDLSPFFPPHQLHPSYTSSSSYDEGGERNPYYVELVIREQKIRLYFVPGVREDTRFETRTRKEISKIDWFSLSSLPTWNHTQGRNGGKGAGSSRSKGEMANGKQAKYYMVTPFISHLKLWIDRNKPKNLPARPTSSLHPHQPAYVAPESATSPRPPPPHQPFSHPGASGLRMHALVPWSDFEEEGETSHLPSETDQGATSTEDEESEEDDERWMERQRREEEAMATQRWQTTQQGSEALQALFFGGSGGEDDPLPPPPSLPSSQHATPPALRPLPLAIQHPHRSASSSSTDLAALAATATPPQVAYERQQSFLQPRPQQSRERQGQQARLLELLSGPGEGGAAGGGGSMSSPPPLTLSPPSHSQQQAGGELLSLLNGMNLSSSSPSALDPAYAALPAQRAAQHQQHETILFGGEGVADPFAPAAVQERGQGVGQEQGPNEEEKKEKHNALLRALFSVAAKPPQQQQQQPSAPSPLPLPVAADAFDAGFDGSRFAPLPPPPAAPVSQPKAKGSLLDILNHHQQPAVVVPASLPLPVPVLVPQPQEVVKDPLQLLREYRNQQNGVVETPPVVPVVPVVVQQQQQEPLFAQPQHPPLPAIPQPQQLAYISPPPQAASTLPSPHSHYAQPPPPQQQQQQAYAQPAFLPHHSHPHPHSHPLPLPPHSLPPYVPVSYPQASQQQQYPHPPFHSQQQQQEEYTPSSAPPPPPTSSLPFLPYPQHPQQSYQPLPHQQQHFVPPPQHSHSHPLPSYPQHPQQHPQHSHQQPQQYSAAPPSFPVVAPQPSAPFAQQAFHQQQQQQQQPAFPHGQGQRYGQSFPALPAAAGGGAGPRVKGGGAGSGAGALLGLLNAKS